MSFEKVEDDLLHHVSDFVPFQARTDQDDGTGTGNNVVGSARSPAPTKKRLLFRHFAVRVKTKFRYLKDESLIS